MKIKKFKKVIITAIAIICVITGGFVIFNQPEVVEAGWWDDTWLYRKPVAITNASTAQTDFQVLITLDTATLITANTMQADCDDIRLTDINSNIIPHWMEPGTCNGASTKIWAKVPSIPASNATVYIYYGNPSAASESALSDTFIREIAGVQGAWDMDGSGSISTGASVADSSGNPNTGTASNVNTTGMAYANSQYEQGIDFDGTDDYVNCGSHESLDITDAITISAWVKLNAYPIDSTGGQIFVKWDDPAQASYSLKLNGTTALPRIVVSPTGAYDANYSLADDVSLSLNTFYHIIGTFDGDYLRVYVDGAEVANKATTNAGIFASTSIAYTGADVYATGAYFNGSIDGVKIYDRALTQAEITDLYGTGGDRQGYVTTNYPNKSLVRKYSASVTIGSPGTQEKGPGPAAYWSFDEGYGDTAYDATDNGNDGDLAGVCPGGATCPTWQTEDMCVSGKCLHFDGDNDYVDCGAGDSLDITDAITVEAWVKPVVDQMTTSQSFLRKEYSYLIVGGEITHKANFYISDGVYKSSGVSTTSIDDGNWHHLAGVYDGSYIRIYVDGTEENSNNIGATTITSNTEHFLLGRRSTGSATQHFNGSIDEVRIYPYARTAAQIRKDYNAGLAGLGGGTEGLGAALGGGGSQKWMTDGLVGHWKMDEASWTGVADEVVDASGAGNHGVSACTGGGCSKPTTGAGKFGPGGVFDGTDDYVDCGSGDSLDITDAITMSAWVKPTASGYRYFIDQYHVYMLIRDDDDTIIFGLNFPGGVTGIKTVATVPNDVWVKVTATRDTTNGMLIYLNGVIQDTTIKWGITKNPAGSINIGGPLYLGCYATTNSFFTGSIDQVRIYNRALSPKEVRDLYNFAPGPVMHLKMDENTGTGSEAVKDTSCNENHGTMEATMTESDWVPGKYGSALDFDGTDDYVSVDDFAY